MSATKELLDLLRRNNIPPSDDLIEMLNEWRVQHNVLKNKKGKGGSKGPTGRINWWNEVLAVGTEKGPRDFLIKLSGDKLEELERKSVGSENLSLAVETFRKCMEADEIQADGEYYFTEIASILKSYIDDEFKSKRKNTVVYSWLKDFIPESEKRTLVRLGEMATIERRRQLGKDDEGSASGGGSLEKRKSTTSSEHSGTLPIRRRALSITSERSEASSGTIPKHLKRKQKEPTASTVSFEQEGEGSAKQETRKFHIKQPKRKIQITEDEAEIVEVEADEEAETPPMSKPVIRQRKRKGPPTKSANAPQAQPAPPAQPPRAPYSTKMVDEEGYEVEEGEGEYVEVEGEGEEEVELDW